MAQGCPHCGFPNPVKTKTGKVREVFETGRAGIGCLLGLALVLGLLFAPLLPFFAIVAAVWAFAKLADATTNKTNERSANRVASPTSTEAQTHSTVTGEPDHLDAEERTERADVPMEDTVGARVRSTASAATAAARTRAARAGRALKRYWRKDGC